MEKSIDSVQSLWSKIRGYNCFGCDPRNLFGLGLNFYPHESGIRSPFKLPHHFSSYPGVVHGGIVAAVLDEVMGNVLLMKTKRLCFTLRFSLKYLAPVLVEKDFSAYAEIKDMNGDFAEVQGSIYDQEDGLVVRAKGTYKAISLEEAIKVMDIDEATLEEFLVFFR